jgi:hypothetical protein
MSETLWCYSKQRILHDLSFIHKISEFLIAVRMLELGSYDSVVLKMELSVPSELLLIISHVYMLKTVLSYNSFLCLLHVTVYSASSLAL